MVTHKLQRKYHKAGDCLRKAKNHHFTSILQRFQESVTYRNSQLSHNWDEEYCKQLHQLALEDHSSTATAAERRRHERNLVFKMNSQGLVGPKRLRAHYSDALQRFGELRTQEGDENVKIPPREQQRQRAHHSFMRRDEDLTLSTKKSVVLRSGKEKPEETTESSKFGSS